MFIDLDDDAKPVLDRFLPGWTEEELWTLAGCDRPEGVLYVEKSYSGLIHLRWRHPCVEHHLVQLSADHLEILLLYLYETGSGTGSRMILAMLRTMQGRTQLKELRLYAQRNDPKGETGYYAWPRMGFSAPLPLEIRRKLGPGMETLDELMSTEKGRAFWKKHGQSMRLTLSVEATAQLEAYVASRPSPS